MQAFGKVAVLYGGQSSEREISLLSGKAVLDALVSEGIDALGVDVDDLHTQLEGFDRAFIMLHGGIGENGTVQAVLENRGIPYTGSGVLGCALTIDKWRTKMLCLTLGIDTPPSIIWDPSLDIDAVLLAIPFPIAVKPNEEGSSIGVYKVASKEALISAIECASEYGQVLIEHWIEGEEYTIGILGDEALPVIRLAPENEFYDYGAKYTDHNTGYHIPSGLSVEQTAKLQAMALRAFKVTACHGWGRVDVMCSHSGHFYFIEVNTVPGMTATSLVPKAAKAVGLSFSQLVVSILAQTVNESVIKEDVVDAR